MPETKIEKRLSCKELAAALGHHPSYVSAMTRAGFILFGGRTTLREALEWLKEHPDFRRDRGRFANFRQEPPISAK